MSVDEILKSQSKFIIVIGSPGTGKTYLINQISKTLNDKLQKISPTNTAAKQINGKTIFKQTFSQLTNLKPIPFEYPITIIDEIFLLKSNEMQVIIDSMRHHSNPKIIMCGDPYQIRQLQDKTNNDQSKGYFYDNIDLSQIQIFNLTTFYRAKDLQLQKILLDYRINKRSEDYIPYFQTIKDTNEMVSLVCNNYIIIVGTHPKQQYYQDIITKSMLKEKNYIKGVIDGKFYRPNQQIFTISRYGSVQEYGIVQKYINDTFTVQFQDNTQKDIKSQVIKSRTEFPIVSADVCTINVIQGQTLKGVIIDMQSLFEFGSYYTAISRVQNITDIYILNQPKKIFEVDENNYFIEKK